MFTGIQHLINISYKNARGCSYWQKTNTPDKEQTTIPHSLDIQIQEVNSIVQLHHIPVVLMAERNQTGHQDRV